MNLGCCCEYKCGILSARIQRGLRYEEKAYGAKATGRRNRPDYM